MPLGEIITAGRANADIQVDFASPHTIEDKIRRAEADVIVNAAAYTAVDQAESDSNAAFAVNASAPEVLARWASKTGSLLVHFSTDYVFDGGKASAYVEDDEPNPLSIYGKSKLAGEQAIRDSGARHLILRTSWVYGLRGKNFFLTILCLAAERDELRIVNDQFGVPNWSRSLAEATANVLKTMIGEPEDMDRRVGTYHLSASGETTWSGFARSIIERLEGDPGIRARTVTGISTKDFPTPATRPRRSTLSVARLAAVFGLNLPSWETCLHQCLTARAEQRQSMK